MRRKDPNGRSGFGRWTVTDPEEIEKTLDAVAADATANHERDPAGFLARYGYVVEVDVEDVEAWAVTLTRTRTGTTARSADSSSSPCTARRASSTTTGERRWWRSAVIRTRSATSRPAEWSLRLAPPPGVVHAAQTCIEGMRSRDTDDACEPRANVDVITGVLVRRDGSREDVAASVEESGRVGGASPAELLAIRARADPDVPYSVRSTRHNFDDEARAYAEHAATVPDSRVWWNGVDDGWNGRYVFMGAF